MTGIERIARILKHQSVDRIGLHEEFWVDTKERWVAEGHISESEDLSQHFGLDIEFCWPLNLSIDVKHLPEVIAQTDDTETFIDANYTTVIRHKKRTAVPGHLDWRIKTRTDWEQFAKPLLKPGINRIDFDGYRTARDRNHAAGRFFAYGSTNGWQLACDICGQQNLFMALVEEPDWTREIMRTYAQLIIDLQEQLFASCGKPDGIWYFEDLGYKLRPFLSPRMYRSIVMPAHKLACDYAKSINVPVIMHSCGFVEPLIPSLIEAGIDCLQAMEIKAGMDLLRIHERYGEKIALFGGIDATILETNDRGLIERELMAKIPLVKQGFGYILHSDHSISPRVDYQTVKFFFERGLALGRY